MTEEQSVITAVDGPSQTSFYSAFVVYEILTYLRPRPALAADLQNTSAPMEKEHLCSSPVLSRWQSSRSTGGVL